jgi:hypothetical protein
MTTPTPTPMTSDQAIREQTFRETLIVRGSEAMREAHIIQEMPAIRAKHLRQAR